MASLDNLPIELTKKGFETFDLLFGFVKPGGHAADLSNRLSREFDLKSELLIGRAKALEETDCLFRHDSKTAKHTSFL